MTAEGVGLYFEVAPVGSGIAGGTGGGAVADAVWLHPELETDQLTPPSRGRNRRGTSAARLTDRAATLLYGVARGTRGPPAGRRSPASDARSMDINHRRGNSVWHAGLSLSQNPPRRLRKARVLWPCSHRSRTGTPRRSSRYPTSAGMCSARRHPLAQPYTSGRPGLLPVRVFSESRQSAIRRFWGFQIVGCADRSYLVNVGFH